MKINYLSRATILALVIEATEHGSLQDTEENITAPLKQLSAEGQLINYELHSLGIESPDDVTEFYVEYLMPLTELNWKTEH